MWLLDIIRFTRHVVLVDLCETNRMLMLCWDPYDYYIDTISIYPCITN